MKIKYLGTAAYEGIPAIFCDCAVCRKSRKAGGKNIRSRSQAIVDDKILIDFPADTFYHSVLHGIELSKVYTCIITHSHSDHLYTADFGARKKGFSHLETDKPLSFYGVGHTYDVIDNYMKTSNYPSETARVYEIKTFEPFVAEGYTIIPLAADHGSAKDLVIYIIGKNSKNILYAHDTGYFPDETWEYLEKSGVRFDFVSLDCTEPMTGCRHNHMNLATCCEVKQRLLNCGCADKNTLFTVNHFSHNGKVTYDELVPIAGKEGFIVSYDGMEKEF